MNRSEKSGKGQYNLQEQPSEQHYSQAPPSSANQPPQYHSTQVSLPTPQPFAPSAPMNSNFNGGYPQPTSPNPYSYANYPGAGYGLAQPPASVFTPPISTSGPLTTTQTQSLRASAAVIQCPYCNSIGLTLTEHQAGLLSWLICCVGTVTTMGLCCPCASCALCADFSTDVEHRCSTCGQLVHTYKRL